MIQITENITFLVAVVGAGGRVSLEKRNLEAATQCVLQKKTPGLQFPLWVVNLLQRECFVTKSSFYCFFYFFFLIQC